MFIGEERMAALVAAPRVALARKRPRILLLRRWSREEVERARGQKLESQAHSSVKTLPRPKLPTSIDLILTLR